MDILSHGLMGAAAGELDRRPRPGRLAWPFVFGALPDIFQALFLYPFVGYVAGRPWLVPHHGDWDGFREAYPYASMVWEVPHSAFFLLLVITPLVLRLRLPKLCILAYGLHLFTDIFSHTGEWSTVPLWPVPWTCEGYWDPWRAPPEQILLCVLLSALVWGATRWIGKRRAPAPAMVD